MNNVNEAINVEGLMTGTRRFDARVTMSQLYAGGRNKVWSWGFKNAIAYNDKSKLTYALRFTVNGMLFKGHVYIVLNGGDLYDIYYCSNRGNIKMIDTDIFCEDLTDVIDRKVERIKEYVR